MFETAKEVALRLGVTVRAVQKWAKQGKFDGAVLQGRMWMIPRGVLPSETSSAGAARNTGLSRLPLPLLRGVYPVEKVKDYIEGMDDEDDRNIALAEYYYYSGDAEKAAEIAEEYLDSEDEALRYSAGILLTFANIFRGHIHLASFVSGIVSARLEEKLLKNSPPEVDALEILTAEIGKTVLEIPVPETPSLREYLKYLPNGIRLYACYVRAFKNYKEDQCERATAICETALAMCNSLYPVAAIHVHIVAAAGYMKLKKIEQAKAHFEEAWALASPAGFLKPFAVHYGILQGLCEVCIKKENPDQYKKIIQLNKDFNEGWRRLHIPDEDDMMHTLSPMEATIAFLYHRGWQKKEIAAHLGISYALVKKHVQVVYEKLGVSDKTALGEYLMN